ncbi:MAG: DUF5010 C-terminal domain-containing protein [Bacteroidales bacterium]|nr:DUF5010 C-terminal domain-containing protein [Bacteroidales bacterium]
MPSVGKTPLPNPKAVKYEAENAAVVSLANVSNDAASGGKSVKNLHMANSFVQFDKIDGGKGGRASIDLCFSGITKAKMKLTVNDVDYSFLNMLPTGGWNMYTGHTGLTVPLKAGATNTIKISGGFGGFNLDYMTITPF